MNDLSKLIKIERKVGEVAYWILTVFVIAWPTYVLLQ